MSVSDDKQSKRSQRRRTAIQYWDEGVIEKIVYQSGELYIAVRHEGFPTVSDDGTVTLTGGYLYGAKNIPEEDVSLNEILIPAGFNPAVRSVDPSNYIGKLVNVLMEGDAPVYVDINSARTSNSSRTIDSNFQRKVRKKSRNNEVDKAVSTALEEISRIEEGNLDEVFEEKYSGVSEKNPILFYEGLKEWDKPSTLVESDVVRPQNNNLVNGIPEEEKPSLRDNCYKPVFIFGGSV